MSKRTESDKPESAADLNVESKEVSLESKEVSLESTESVAAEIPKAEKPAKAIEKVVSLEASTMAVAKKIGVVRYLQDNPQEPYIETLMKKKYAMQAKTVSEWDAIAKQLASIKY